MRLRRLDLTRYGHFDGASLDFGPAREGADVTIVLGPNEAGKSTAFAGWLDLLFGYERNHPYTFRFERGDLLVGAELDTPDGPLTLRRTNRALTDADGRELGAHVIASLLHGLDRPSYRTRFSLDDEVLRKGGEEIATAKGDLGRLLHAGTSGLSGLSDVLDLIEADVQGFYKKAGSKQRLPTAKRELRDLDDELEASRLTPIRFDDLRAAVEDGRAAVAREHDGLEAARRDLALAEAAERRRTLSDELSGLDSELATYADGPDLPSDAAADIATRAAEVRQAETAILKARAAKTEAEARLADLTADPDGLALAELLEQLDGMVFDGNSLVTRVSGAEADLGRLRGRRATQWQEVLAAAARISGPGIDPRALSPDPDHLDRIDAALANLRSAKDALNLARRTMTETEKTQGEEPSVPVGEQALREAMDCHLAMPALDGLRAEANEKARAAEEATSDLPSDWLARLQAQGGLPSAEEVEATARATERATEKADAARDAAEAARDAVNRAEAALTAALNDPVAIDLAALQELRRSRDDAWRAHRDSLDAASAERFQTAMWADDHATAAHAQGAEARARVQALREASELARAEKERAELALAASRTAADAAGAQAGRLAKRLLLLDRDAPPDAFAIRQRRLSGALDRTRAADRARDELAAATAAQTRLDEALATALAATGTETAPSREAAQARLAQLRAAADTRKAWQRRQSDLDSQRAAVEEARQECEANEQILQRLIEGTWAEALSPADLRAALSPARDLAARLLRIDELDHRIGQMEAALAAFSRIGDQIAEIMGTRESATDLLRAARERLTAAAEIRSEVARLTADRRAHDDAERNARIDLSDARGRIAMILDGQQICPDADPTAEVRRLGARDALRQKLQAARVEYERLGRGHDPARLAEVEQGADPAHLATCADHVAEAEARRDDAQRALGGAEAELATAERSVGGAEIDQRRAILLEELRGQAQDAAARMIGLAAARAALRRMGEDRRGPMLRDTETAFRRLTHGAWTRLETWVEGQDERLVGISDGRSVEAGAMSTGTRGQLYLALRIAGHAAFVREAGPLPFVTDDILESFDDDRAAAALELTAELGQRGQAILFTHHSHLIPIARERIPGVRVFEMPMAAPVD